MKNKLKLANLEVQSFKTTMDDNNADTVKGGTLTTPILPTRHSCVYSCNGSCNSCNSCNDCFTDLINISIYINPVGG